MKSNIKCTKCHEYISDFTGQGHYCHEIGVEWDKYKRNLKVKQKEYHENKHNKK